MRREYGSIPDVGSSKNTTLLSPISAIATDSLRFYTTLTEPTTTCPPDRVLLHLFSFSVRPTSYTRLLILAGISASGTFWSFAAMYRCSFTRR